MAREICAKVIFFRFLLSRRLRVASLYVTSKNRCDSSSQSASKPARLVCMSHAIPHECVAAWAAVVLHLLLIPSLLIAPPPHDRARARTALLLCAALGPISPGSGSGTRPRNKLRDPHGLAPRAPALPSTTSRQILYGPPSPAWHS